jgi:hypothetical protein
MRDDKEWAAQFTFVVDMNSYIFLLLYFSWNSNNCALKTSLFFGTVEPDTSWDIIKSDLWEDGDSDDGYVLVKQEDVVDGITSFMAACLLSLKRTKVAIFFTWWDHHGDRGVHVSACCMGGAFIYLMCEFHVCVGPASWSTSERLPFFFPLIKSNCEISFLLGILILNFFVVHIPALRKMFSAEKKKSKIRKAWDGTKLIYNVTSWGATAVG